jgi:hypothetical protein
MQSQIGYRRPALRAQASLAAAITAVALGSGALAAPASATTSGVWFYATDVSAAGPNGLVKVELKGGKIVARQTLVKTSSANNTYFPSSALGSHGAGVQATYDKANFDYKQALYVWDDAAHKLRVLTSIKTDQVVSPSLFDKGNAVAYLDHHATTWTIRTMSVTGSARTTRFTVPLGLIPSSLAVSASGKQFYFGAIQQGSVNNALVYRYVLGAKKAVALIKPIKEGHIDALSLSPNGKTIAFGPGTFPPPAHGIQTLSVAAGGTTKALAPQGDPATLSWSADGARIYSSDQNANGWSETSVATGHSTAEDATSTGSYTHPIRA